MLLARRASPAAQVELLREARARARGAAEESVGRARRAAARLLAMRRRTRRFWRELRRLAEVTGPLGGLRWPSRAIRFHRARRRARSWPSPAKRRRWSRRRCKDRLRAFRAYLRAYQLAPRERRRHSRRICGGWRAIVGEIAGADRAHRAARPAAAVAAGGPSGMVIASTKPPREQTLEVELDEVMFDESKPIVRPRETTRDPTWSCRSSTWWRSSASRAQAEAAADDGAVLSDVVAVRRKRRRRRRCRRVRAVQGSTAPGTSWRWCMMGLPARRRRRALPAPPGGEPRCGKRARAICHARSRRWPAPSGSIPIDAEARAALERLAERQRRAGISSWRCSTRRIGETGKPQRAVRLHLDSAGVRERQSELRRRRGAATSRARHAARDEEAMTRLETIYRQSRRWKELATLLERRLSGLMERLPPGDQRRLRALELADVYERLGNTYEAIGAWQRVARGESRPRAGVRVAGAAVRERRPVVQGHRVADARARHLDGEGKARPGARAADPQAHRRDLRARAGAARPRHRGLRRRARRQSGRRRGDRGAGEAVREAERAGAISRRCSRRKSDRLDKESRVARARAAGAALDRQASATTTARGGGAAQLRKQRPDDDELAQRLERALGRAGRIDEQAEAPAQAHPLGQARRSSARRAGPADVELALREGAQRHERGAEVAGEGARAAARRSAGAGRAGPAARGRLRLGRLRRGARARGGGRGVARAGGGARSSTRRACTSSAARTTAARGAARAGAASAIPRPSTPRAATSLYRRAAARRRSAPTSWRGASWSMTGERAPSPSAGRSCRRRWRRGAAGAAIATKRRSRFREAISSLRPGWAPAMQGLVDLAAQSARGTRSRRCCSTRPPTACRPTWRRSSIAGWRRPPSIRAGPTTPTQRCWRPIG